MRRRAAVALLLEVFAAVPAVGVLAKALARLVVDALCISDGGPETEGQRGVLVSGIGWNRQVNNVS